MNKAILSNDDKKHILIRKKKSNFYFTIPKNTAKQRSISSISFA